MMRKILLTEAATKYGIVADSLEKAICADHPKGPIGIYDEDGACVTFDDDNLRAWIESETGELPPSC